MPTDATLALRPATEPVTTERRAYVPTGRPPGRPPGSPNKPKPSVEVPSLRPRYLQIASACRYADVSVTTMRRWIREGVVRSTKIGSLILVSVDSLDRLIE